MSTQAVINAFTQVIGHKFLISDLERQLADSTLSFTAEMEHEANEIYENSFRSYREILSKCHKGKLAEIAARSLINPADGTPWLRHATKRYHDCITANGTFVEIKNRADIETTLYNYLNHDAIHYNKSTVLLMYAADATHIWLDRVVDVKAALAAKEAADKDGKKTLAEIFSATQHTVQLAGSSFTIYLSQLKSFEERGILEIVFTDGVTKWVKPVEWFYKHKRESNSGAARGGYYVYKNQVTA